MNNNLLKHSLLSAAFVLGLVSLAWADDSMIDPPATSAAAAGNLSLLGQKHGTLTYSYINLDGTSVHADSYTLKVNEPLAFGLDGIFAYDYTRSGEFAGSHVSQHTISAALRAFSTSYNWGKPYVEGGLGHVWSRFAGARNKSVVWAAGAGVEFQVMPRATVTPYVQYVHTPNFANDDVWNFGVKGSYWIDSSWAVTAGFERDDEQNTAFTVGVNFRY